jgi:UPF0755 protein
MVGVFYWEVDQPLRLKTTPLEFNLAPGSSTKQAAQQVIEAGVELRPWLFVWLARLTHSDTKIKAGSYELEAGLTTRSLLMMLTRGDVTQAELTIIEGWNIRQLREALNQHPDLRHDSQGLSDKELMAKLGLNDFPHLEGLFFPDTYSFAKRSSDLAVLKRAHRAMLKQLNFEWAKRRNGVPLTSAYEGLILASIVEKETGRGSDRPNIASVFHNRLRTGMRLQTDPTVIYGIGPTFDGNLTRHDLTEDTPYNTYTRAGLPPGPIAMPGQASLRAAMQAPITPYYYFVARGDGSSAFSRSLDEHNRAVQKYQKRGAR